MADQIAKRADAAGQLSEAIGGRRWSRDEQIFYGCILALAVIGVFSGRQRNVLPAESVIDVVFFIVALRSMRSLSKIAQPVVVLAVLYLACKTGLAIVGLRPGILDFIQAYKAYIYLIFVPFFAGKKGWDRRNLSVVVTLLCILALIKYSYSVALGFDARPGLFGENNFELAMILGLFYVAYPSFGRRQRLFLMAVLFGIILLAGSRSASVSFVLVVAALYIRLRTPFVILQCAAVAGAAFVAYQLFVLRGGRGGAALEYTDRFNFLRVFLRETVNWSITDFLFGAPPITPLSHGACESLSYFAGLFSYSSPGRCYSVILHSFILRGVFDQGLVGLLLLFGCIWILMRRSNVPARECAVIVGIACINSMAVSGPNNVFVVLVIAIIVATRGVAEKEGLVAAASDVGSAPRAQLESRNFRTASSVASVLEFSKRSGMPVGAGLPLRSRARKE